MFAFHCFVCTFHFIFTNPRQHWVEHHYRQTDVAFLSVINSFYSKPKKKKKTVKVIIVYYVDFLQVSSLFNAPFWPLKRHSSKKTRSKQKQESLKSLSSKAQKVPLRQRRGASTLARVINFLRSPRLHWLVRAAPWISGWIRQYVQNKRASPQAKQQAVKKFCACAWNMNLVFSSLRLQVTLGETPVRAGAGLEGGRKQTRC